MPFLLVRDGKLVVQDTRLARESCTQCCEGSEPLWFEVADCCFPDESFWIFTTQTGRNGEVLYTPGVPVTIRLGAYCATTRPDVALTYDEVIALDPDADFVLIISPGPEVVPAGCDDPICEPCPQCCVVKHIPADSCGGPACCEHGGSFTVNIGVTATYQEHRRVYGWSNPNPECLECFKYSAEAQSVSASSSYFIGVRFTCNGDGTYTGTCLGGRRTIRRVDWDVTGPVGHGCDLQDGFAPVRILRPGDLNINEGCAEMFGDNESASTWFNTQLLSVIGKVPGIAFGRQEGFPGGALGSSLFGRQCFGTDNETQTIDRSWTTDPCEAVLSAIGDVRQTNRSWNSSQTCDGGDFTYDASYESGISTRFIFLPNQGWLPWTSRELYRVQGTWSIERSGTSTCLEPQCVGNPGGLPPLLFDRRAAVPAVKQSEARKGCSSCGKDGGL